MTGTLHGHQYISSIISRSLLLRIRNVSDKRCRETQNTYYMLSKPFFRKSRLLWDNVTQYCRPQMTQWRMRISCWIP